MFFLLKRLTKCYTYILFEKIILEIFISFLLIFSYFFAPFSYFIAVLYGRDKFKENWPKMLTKQPTEVNKYKKEQKGY